MPTSEPSPLVRPLAAPRRAVSLLALAVAVAATAVTPAPAEEAAAPAAAGDAASATIDAFIREKAIDTSKDGWKQKLPKPPKATFESGKTYYWDVVTSVGKLSIRLMPDVAPMHVSSTLYLTKLGFYDGTVFHRVIPGFMAQGGDPTGTGRGDPGYEYDGETSSKVKHDKGGLLSMANAGPGTDGSQFFLTFVATPWLDGKHTIFGEVVSGEETLKELEKRGSRSGQTSEKLTLEKATIRVE